MSSPRCTLNRWGSGGSVNGSCSSIPKTQEAKELEDKLKKMMEERNKIDTMWTNSTHTINKDK